jgi:glutaredoxin
MTKELVMYTRSSACPFVSLAKRVLSEYKVAYRELFIDRDDAARQRVVEWTGFLSVPTIIVAESGALDPADTPAPLARGTSPRGVDRGSMITEPNVEQLTRWLKHNGFIANGA